MHTQWLSSLARKTKTFQLGVGLYQPQKVKGGFMQKSLGSSLGFNFEAHDPEYAGCR